jgi:hypothetical protein
MKDLKQELLDSQKSEGQMFIDNCKLKMLLDKQHSMLERYMMLTDNLRRDVKDLKGRLASYAKMDHEQIVNIRRDTYIMGLEKGKNEAMNKLRTLEKKYAELIRKS